MASNSSYTPTELESAIIREPLLVTVETTVREAIALMSESRTSCSISSKASVLLEEVYGEARSSCVLVVEGEQLVGILTQGDIIRLCTEKRPLEQLLVGEVMTASVLSWRESELSNFFEVIDLLRKNQICHLPLVDDSDRLVGLITHETLRYISHPIDLLRLRTVEEVMTTEVICASPESNLLEIACLMTQYRVNCVVLVETDFVNNSTDVNVPVGILTEGDIVKFNTFCLDLENYSSQQLMSTPVFSVAKNENLWRIHELMSSQYIRRVLVTGSHGELLGIVTQTSMLKVLNPLELYKMTEILEGRISELKLEKIRLLENQAHQLDEQVKKRTLELEQAHHREQLVFEITTRIRSWLNLPEILDETVKQVRILLNCDRVLIYQFKADFSGDIVAESVVEPYTSCFDKNIKDTCFEDNLSIYQDGDIFVAADIDQVGLSECHLSLLKQLEVRANLVVPIVLSNHEAESPSQSLWGLFAIHQCSNTRLWSSEEIQMVQQLALQVAIAIQQAIAYDELQKELQERQKIQTYLQETEERYATLTDLIPVGVFRTDKEGDCIYVNEEYCQMTGRIPGETIGLSWQISVHPEDSDRINEAWKQTQANHHPFKEEYRLEAGENQLWVFGQIVPEFSVEETVNGYVGTITDISEQKAALCEREKAETALQDLNQSLEATVKQRTQELSHLSDRLQLAIKSAQMGIWDWDISQNHLTWDDQMYKIYGVSPLECPQTVELWKNSLHPEDAELTQAILQESLRGEREFNPEFRIVRPDGSIVFIKANALIIRNPEGEPQRMIGTNVDITESKQAESDRQQLLRELSDLKLAIDHSAIVAVTDASGVITYANNRFCEISGYSQEELIGKTHRIINSGYHPHSFFTNLWRTISSGKVWHGEICNRSKNGFIYWTESTIVPFLNSQKKVSQYLAIRFDITARKQAEARLLDYSHEIEDLYNKAPCGYHSLDAEGRYVKINDTELQWLGYSREQLLGRRLADFLTPESGEIFESNFELFKQQGYLKDLLLEMISSNGHVFPVLLNSSAVYNPQGEYLYSRSTLFDITDLKSAQIALQKNHNLLQSITIAQSQFITSENRLTIFEGLLSSLLTLTDSEYGFIGEVMFRDNGGATMEETFLKIRGVPYLKTHSISNVAWDEATEKFYQENHEKGMEFDNMNTLFGAVIMTGKPVIANSPSSDPRRGGTPNGHPPLNSFLGLPFFSGSTMVGIVGIANKPGGYHEEMIDDLQAFLVTCGNLIEGYRLHRKRNEAEEAKKAAEQEIAKQLASIEAAGDGIGIVQDDLYQYVNHAHLVMFGYSEPEDLVGHSWRKIYSPTEIQRFENEVFPILMRDRYWTGEAIATRQDGTSFAEELSLTLTEDKLLICVCRDISDRQETEAKLRQTNQELMRATRLKDEFLANMSHELRTPLNAILGMTEGMQEEVFGTVGDRQKQALQTIERSASHLLELINDILDLAKIEAGEMKLDLNYTSIRPLCQSSIAFIKQQAFKKGISINVQIPQALPDLYIDERRLRQVLINLLNNAVKFTPSRGKISLEVKLQPPPIDSDKSRVRFAVIDTGIGINEEQLSKLFKPFTQIDSALNRQYEGTGLGLSLVKRIVEMHGGTVNVISKVGSGSQFIFEIPCDDILTGTNTPHLSSNTSEFLTTTEEVAQVSPLILIAEDNEANIMSLSSYLGAKGYRLIIAKDGQQAIDLAQSESPNLILMDIQMPGIDGLEAIKRIRQIPTMTEVPIIALTALAMTGDREKCLEAGANDYVAKPVKLKQLNAKIQEILDL
ncbi:PAS domain S-box protein [Arthrospira platensis]|uniref:PAS domain S-box protein n=1 Tax=Limnospira TaxID=2596745 RepID=UPI0007A0F15E|nr:PAS domain S-box protein [Arthrospira platensis]AMW28057.1 histidine kinase [Arthrospira platensis YZ]MBD2668769.1 PAS domain S-box protein [Arthrospira platensis FACHB-439]MBD2710134.1 PAS domain S-box protein [Arthrospira platensis FACHB-835]MDT9184550.1 PAS domain S-box protein [Limnospira sp. PMC 289.06]QQW30856.1 PAS domain S-box protein [Arthrospira sp. PCC 9108]